MSTLLNRMQPVRSACKCSLYVRIAPSNRLLSRSIHRSFSIQSASQSNTQSTESIDDFIENDQSEATIQSKDSQSRTLSRSVSNNQSNHQTHNRSISDALQSDTRFSKQSNNKSDNQSQDQSTSKSSSSINFAALTRDCRRYFFIPWRFRQYAREDDLTAALTMLETEGRDIVVKQLAEQALEDAKKLEEAKKLNPRLRTKRKSSSSQSVTPSILDALTCLAAHPYSTYASLARALSSRGLARSVIRLINRLQQVARTSDKQELIPRSDMLAMAITAFALSDNYPPNQTMEHFHKQSSNQTNNQSSSDPLFDLKSHHVVFDLLTSLKSAPLPEFYHSLQLLHAQHGTARTLLADLASLHSSKHAPKIDVYVDAISHFGLTLNDADAALAIFLHMTELFLPSSAAFNAMIAVLAHHGQFAMAQQLVRDMREQRQHPDASTYASLARALANSGRVQKAWQLYDWVRNVERPNIERSLSANMKADIHLAMMDIARATGKWEDVARVWQDLSTDNIRADSRVASVFLQAALAFDKRQEARHTVQMLIAMPKLDPLAYRLAFEVFARDHEFASARELFQRFAQNQKAQGRGVNPAVLTSLLDTVEPHSIKQLFEVLRYHLTYDLLPQRTFMTNWIQQVSTATDDRVSDIMKVVRLSKWDSNDARIAQKAIVEIANLLPEDEQDSSAQQ